MRRRGGAAVRPRKRSRAFLAMGLAALAAASACASREPAPEPRAGFPLDPREGLAGPFDRAIERGWRALAAAEAARAEKEFARASASSPRAAAIGMIEAQVIAGRAGDAVAGCAAALAEGEPTLPLLIACGEARARTSQPVAAYELYERAAVRAASRPAIVTRAAELREAATRAMLDWAQESAAEGRADEALSRTARAVAWNPDSAAVRVRAAEIECAAGDRDRALESYRHALVLGGVEPPAAERAGDLALEAGDLAMAVAVFDELAETDARFAERAAEARLAFRISNWPEAERQAARARRLTRSGAALLAWWTFPEVRDARVISGVIATDVLDRRDSRPMMRAVSLGLLDVDGDTHRARPDASLTRAAAARLLLRLTAMLPARGPGPECLRGAGPPRTGADAIRVAAGCALLSESGGSAVSGAEFTRGLDRLRSLYPAGEAMNRD